MKEKKKDLNMLPAPTDNMAGKTIVQIPTIQDFFSAKNVSQ